MELIDQWHDPIGFTRQHGDQRWERGAECALAVATMYTTNTEDGDVIRLISTGTPSVRVERAERP